MSGWEFDAPVGVDDYVASAYRKLVRPLIIANSLVSLPCWAAEGDEYLCSYEEHLKNARQWAQEFLHQEEVRIRAEAPEVFAVSKVILKSTWRLSSALSCYRHSLGPQIVESPDGRHVEMPAEWGMAFTAASRNELSQIPDPPIKTLTDRLRTAVCQWEANLRHKSRLPPQGLSRERQKVNPDGTGHVEAGGIIGESSEGHVTRTSARRQPSAVATDRPAANSAGDIADPGSVADSNPPTWCELGPAKQAVLTVLQKANKRLDGKAVAKQAGYTHGTLRHHFGRLQEWKLIDRNKGGYGITESGDAFVPSELE